MNAENFSKRLDFTTSKIGNIGEAIKAAGISYTTLSRWKEGADPKMSNLIALADAADVSLDWLLTGRGSPDGHTITQIQPTQPNVSVEDAVATLQAMIQESQPKLTEDEAFLLKEFRTLDADQKKLILRFLVAGFDGLNKAVVNGSNFKIENSFNGK